MKRVTKIDSDTRIIYRKHKAKQAMMFSLQKKNGIGIYRDVAFTFSAHVDNDLEKAKTYLLRKYKKDLNDNRD